MGYNRANFNRIREMYQEKYKIAEAAAQARRQEVYLKIPALRALDKEMGSMGLAIMNAALSGKPEEAIAEIRAQNAQLREIRGEILVQHGFPADYTDIKYDCPLCGDTGYVDFKMCICMKRDLIAAAYESSGMGQLIKTQTFENFSLEYYRDTPENYKTMQKVLEFAKAYVENYGKPDANLNMAFFGGTGLGKTHLSSAIAGALIAKGVDVYYAGAVQMLSDFEAQRFGNSTSGEELVETSRYLDCDLLIIDDLGTEVYNQFTASVMYNIINTRLNRGLGTLINSNLLQTEFRKRYWDRITSRVFGEFMIMPFVGTDIRAQKMRKKS